MKILQVVHAFPPYNIAGVEVYTYSLCRGLGARHEVYVFCRVCNPREKEYSVNYRQDGKIRIYSLNNTFKYCESFTGLYRNPQISRAFSEVLDAINPDIVHIQHLQFLSADIIHEIKKRGIPIVYTLHDYWLICPQWHFLRNKTELCSADNIEECIECLKDWLMISRGPKFIYRMLKRVMPVSLLRQLKSLYVSSSNKKADKGNLLSLIRQRIEYMRSIVKSVDIFISPSQFLRSRFIKFGIPEGKNLLVTHGVRGFEVNSAPDKLKKGITFGFIGTLLPAKGIHILLEAFNPLKGESILNIYGKFRPYDGFEDYPDRLEKLARGRRVHFKGGFDNDKIGDIFSEIDVLVAPSLWMENSPLVIQEAFWAKTPVIASRIGGIPELIREDINGLLFNPGDTQDLRAKMELLIEKPEIIERLRKNILPPKGMEEHAIEIENIYTELIEGAGVTKKIREAEVAG